MERKSCDEISTQQEPYIVSRYLHQVVQNKVRLGVYEIFGGRLIPFPGLEENSLACSGAAGNHQGSQLASLHSRVSNNNSSLALRSFVATENSSGNVSLFFLFVLGHNAFM